MKTYIKPTVIELHISTNYILAGSPSTSIGNKPADGGEALAPSIRTSDWGDYEDR